MTGCVSITKPVVRLEADRDRPAWIATYTAGTLKLSNFHALSEGASLSKTGCSSAQPLSSELCATHVARVHHDGRPAPRVYNFDVVCVPLGSGDSTSLENKGESIAINALHVPFSGKSLWNYLAWLP